VFYVSVTIRFLITRISIDQSTIVGIPLDGLPTIFHRQAPLYSPSQSAVSGFGPSNQPLIAKGALRDRPRTLSIPTTCLERLCDGSHVVKVKLEGIDNESSPCSTIHQAHCPLRTRLLTGLEGIQLPLGSLVTFHGLDPRTLSVAASPLPDLLHMA
jgi:hypothetical protein